MHGKRREEYKSRFRDPKVAAALAHKAQQWHFLCRELAQRREQQPERLEASDADAAEKMESLLGTLKLTEKVLMVNPDPAHIWNHRREILLLLPCSTVSLADELKLTQAALQHGNPKAYAAWFHRKWTIQQQQPRPNDTLTESRFLSVQPLLDVLRNETALTAEFLARDERNFHCWNYRRFLVSAVGQIILSSDDAIEEPGHEAASHARCFDGEWTFLKYLASTAMSGSASNPALQSLSLQSNTAGAQIGRGTQILVRDDGIGNLEEETSLGVSQGASRLWSVDTDTIDRLWELVHSEWKFAAKKIEDNFSNGSAFFYRSQLLPYVIRYQLLTDDSQSLPDLLEDEFQLIENAVCTEPDDQTAWWYHAFLLRWIPDASTFTERLQEQADLLRDLLEEAPDNKWIMLGLYRLTDYIPDDVSGINRAELVKKLQIVDSDRAERYRQMSTAG